MVWAPAIARTAAPDPRPQLSLPIRLTALAAAMTAPSDAARTSSVGNPVDVVPTSLADPLDAALRALSAGVAGGESRPQPVRAVELAVLRAAPPDADAARPSALGRRMGLQGAHDRVTAPTAAGADAESPGAEPEHSAATRMGRGAGGMGGSGSDSAMASGGQGSAGAAILCGLSGSADGAGVRLARVDSRPAALHADGPPLVRPG
jgi:hypothetical protein